MCVPLVSIWHTNEYQYILNTWYIYNRHGNMKPDTNITIKKTLFSIVIQYKVTLNIQPINSQHCEHNIMNRIQHSNEIKRNRNNK